MNGSTGVVAERQPGGILGRLARDRRGNTLAMMAIALIPLVGMAGSAIDTARVYYVKVRLQQACDAGVLAGRKFMDGTDFNTNAQRQAQAFFANNFKTGMMGSQSPSFVPVRTVENQVAGTASATVPMTLMKMAGFAPVTVSVACEAKLEIPNLDIMFVLDTTGSMADTNPGDSANKITGLRNAVINFYDTVESAKKSGTQVRYGAVPYSSNVNVGLLLKPEWVADKWTYQSRIPDGTTTSTSTTTDNADYVWYKWSGWTRQSGNSGQRNWRGSNENCVAPANTYGEQWKSDPWQPAPNNEYTQYTTARANGSTYWASISNGVCTIYENWYDNVVQTRTDYYKRNPNKGKKTTTTTTVYNWQYRPVEYDVRPLKGNGQTVSGGKISVQVGDNHKFRDVSWNAVSACIEERQTVKQDTYPTIPTAAYDLDVDMIPTSDPATQWKPWLPELVYARQDINNWQTQTITTSANYTNIGDYNANGNRLAYCPSPAQRMQMVNRGNLVSFVNTLTVGGATHHDIGFLWGLRLMSPTGLFASDNVAPGGSQISRHLIFMTDGQTDTSRQVYEAYGLSALDQRRTSGMPTDTQQNTIVANRLSALCDVARRKNITVWVIAFGTTLSPMLSNCASDGRAFEASNTAQLNNAFSNIAAQIAKLRVSR
ncbi:TadE/TadG family protein [Sphingomonas sp. 2R-10]|uniref:TadE/TadG family type IV pilus assembly protein n=1 Tax=Sphingomonas sp. 2R-10 TaxID=3045148 RepID=UPI0019D035BD|nr:TadE/TadG family type IV pilus assembly protein [Sphingomonas sp. 2R-10]MDJ0278092.1 TadE/TadG family protein [Sphingomonas sp. 2R-10]